MHVVLTAIEMHPSSSPRTLGAMWQEYLVLRSTDVDAEPRSTGLTLDAKEASTLN